MKQLLTILFIFLCTDSYSQFISSVCSNVNAASGDSTEWVSPTGKGTDQWTNSENIYDGNLETSGTCSTHDQYVILTIAAISCTKVRINAGKVAGGEADLKVEVYYDEDYNTIHDGVLTEDTWVEIALGSEKTVTSAKISLGDFINSEVWEFEFLKRTL